MKKIISLNIIAITIFLLLFSAGCYILLQENRFNISIASIISNSHDLNLKKHLLVLGLLPVYIAAIIFGTGLLGIYLGSKMQQFINRFFSKKSFMDQKKTRLSNMPFSM